MSDTDRPAKRAYDAAAEALIDHQLGCSACRSRGIRVDCPGALPFIEAENAAWTAYRQDAVDREGE